MTPDTIFRIASQTKALVSVAAMVLQEEGKLLLSHPVGRYLPEFQKTTVAVAKEGGYDVVDAKRPITLRDLLTHTAGLSYASGPAKERWLAAGLPDWYFAERDEPMGAIVPKMAELPFDTHPGERWVYGFATDILGVVLERASGQSLDELIRTRILEPLAMSDTHFYLPAEKRSRLAAVYRPKPDGTIERAPDKGGRVSQGAYVDGPRKAFAGGAGMLSTASDYARFLQMLLNGGTLDGRRVLSRKSVELMTAGHLGEMPFRDGQDFGLGFAVVEDLGRRGTPGSKGEYSWGGAYHTTYWVDPKEKLVVTYMSQLIGSGPPIDDHETVRALVYQAIAD
jgi:CubicO group peptidase (beta-lactamase class C family)